MDKKFLYANKDVQTRKVNRFSLIGLGALYLLIVGVYLESFLKGSMKILPIIVVAAVVVVSCVLNLIVILKTEQARNSGISVCLSCLYWQALWHISTTRTLYAF